MDKKDWDKVSNNYFDELSSPFEKGVKSPLNHTIAKIKYKHKMIVCDAGCGVGNLIPTLSKNFKEVFAFDFSIGMVNYAKKNCGKLRNVNIFQGDLTKMNKMAAKFDAIFSINSIIMPDTRAADKSFENIFLSLKKNGKLIAVLPALESVLYESMLVHETQLQKYKDEKKAAIMTRRIVGKQYYDFYTGMIDVEGKQKHYYKFEIEHRLKKAGFKNVKFNKVLYPWSIIENTPLPKSVDEKDVRLWDWFVVAEK